MLSSDWLEGERKQDCGQDMISVIPERIWLFAHKLHFDQSAAFGFGQLAPKWSELSMEDRIDWWISADRRLNPGSYAPAPVEPFRWLSGTRR